MRDNLNELNLPVNDLKGATVKNLSGDRIGKINDLMLDVDRGSIAYAVLEVDTGFLNLGSKYFAIPWQAFSFEKHYENEITLDVDKQKLEDSPGFDKEDWPTGPQYEFIDRVHTYYGINRDSNIL